MGKSLARWSYRKKRKGKADRQTVKQTEISRTLREVYICLRGHSPSVHWAENPQSPNSDDHPPVDARVPKTQRHRMGAAQGL